MSYITICRYIYGFKTKNGIKEMIIRKEKQMVVKEKLYEYVIAISLAYFVLIK